MQLRGQVLQQEGHPALNGLGGDDMVVIQHKRNITSIALHQFIRQHSQHGLWRRGLRGTKQRKRGLADLGIKRLQGGNQVRKKARGVVVLRF
jgi:hypothetical protein